MHVSPGSQLWASRLIALLSLKCLEVPVELSQGLCGSWAQSMWECQDSWPFLYVSTLFAGRWLQLKGGNLRLSLLGKLFNLPKCLTHSLQINQPTQRYPGPTSSEAIGDKSQNHRNKSSKPPVGKRTAVTFGKHYSREQPWTTSSRRQSPHQH